VTILTFAQETVLPNAQGQPGAAAGTATPGTGVQGTANALPTTTGGGAGPTLGPGIFTILLLVVGLMLVSSLMGQKRERRKREAMISAIKKHDRVQTIGGVIGSVVEVKPDYVVLKVDESSNTRITFARSAVQQVLTSAPVTESSTGK
jgi:preprotein translocase subunit YajC